MSQQECMCRVDRSKKVQKICCVALISKLATCNNSFSQPDITCQLQSRAEVAVVSKLAEQR